MKLHENLSQVRVLFLISMTPGNNEMILWQITAHNRDSLKTIALTEVYAVRQKKKFILLYNKIIIPEVHPLLLPLTMQVTKQRILIISRAVGMF